MHEFSIAASLLQMVQEHATERGADRVLSVEVRIGERSGVEIELLKSAWSLVRERTSCQEVALTVTFVEACWKCARCRREISRGALLACPACGEPARLETGDEILLSRIEMEVRGHV